MAVDTTQKRFSLIGFGSPVPRLLPLPQGAFIADDRALLLYLYSGIVLSGAVAPPVETLVRNWKKLGRRRKRKKEDARRVIDTSTAEVILRAVQSAVDRQSTDAEFLERAADLARLISDGDRARAAFYRDLLQAQRRAQLDAAITAELIRVGLRDKAEIEEFAFLVMLME